MEDKSIVDLFWRRDESAIRETKEKYNRYLSKIAYNILGNLQDCEECLNDTYLRAWNTIPPGKPSNLSLYLAKIIREQSINLYRRHHAAKRGKGEYALSLEELAECLSGQDTPEQEIDMQLLTQLINGYLRTVSTENRILFIRRYYYCDSVQELAKRSGFSKAKVKTVLFRMRGELKEYLGKEGFLL